MRMIPIKKGLSALLLLEAVIITILTIAFMVNLYQIYTNLVYRELVEALNLHVIISDAKFSEFENLSFEMLSNRDIQSNLLKYNDSPTSYESYKAVNDLYTQLFTRRIMNKNIISISFVFLDDKRVDTGRINLSALGFAEIFKEAVAKNGSCGWTANVAGENVVTLYRLIKDISGNNFMPLGVLIINIDARCFLDYTTDLSPRHQPDIICLAGEEILSGKPMKISPAAVLEYANSPHPYDLVSLSHEPCFISSKELGHSDWRLIYILPTKNLLSSIKKMNVFYGIALLLIVMTVTIIGYRFASAISRPLAQLTTAMKKVEDGDYSLALNNGTLDPRLAIYEVAQLSRGFSKMIQEIDYLINEVYAKQLMIMEMRYKMLQQQINPHFLYNTLDTINWKAAKNGAGEISVIVRSLSKLLRGSIKGPDIISVGEDLDFVEDYISIQKIRFEERLDFRSQIPATHYSYRIPRLTLQPIVENCIIHNLEKYAGICRVSISSSLADGRLKIFVEDNGRGVDLQHVAMVLSGQVAATNTSIGLKNIDQRIKISFGEHYGISVENKAPTGTRVTIVLPCKEGLHEDTVDS